MKVYKKLLAVLLACVLSLSLLTACGGGGGGNGGESGSDTTTNLSLMRSIGCSEGIKEDEALQTYATNAMAALVKLAYGQITQAQYQTLIAGYAAEGTAELEKEGINTKTNYCEAFGRGSNISEASGALKDAMVSSGYSPSQMKQYGVARSAITIDGQSVVIMFAAFTF